MTNAEKNKKKQSQTSTQQQPQTQPQTQSQKRPKPAAPPTWLSTKPVRIIRMDLVQSEGAIRNVLSMSTFSAVYDAVSQGHL